MKRKLISFDVFKKIEEQSLSTAQEELIGAEDVLAKTLDVDDLKLFCFGESDVTYQTVDGTFIHANYKLDNDQLVLENIEGLVSEEESEEKEDRQKLSSMAEALLDNNDTKAGEHIDHYFKRPCIRRGM